MTVEPLVIEVREDGSRLVRRQLEGLGTAAGDSAVEVGKLQGSLDRSSASARRSATAMASNSAAAEDLRADLLGLSVAETRTATAATAMSASLGAAKAATAGASVAVDALRNDLATLGTEVPQQGGKISAVLRRIAELLRLRRASDLPRGSDFDDAAAGARRLGNELRKTGGIADQLRQTIRLIGAGLVVRSLINAADAYTTMSNRIRLVTASAEEAAVVQERLFEIAQRSRAPLESTAELYARLGQSTKTLGISQNELLGITETINRAIALSGATANEAGAGMVQFAQGLAAGRLNGDELRSVLEQMPVLADLIAKEFGVTRGELRKLGEEGKLTSDRIIKALQEAAPEIERQYAKTTPTIRQAFTVLNNAYLQYVGQADKATGVSKLLAGAIIVLAKNMDVLAAAILALGAAMAIAFAASAVRRIQALIAVLRVLFLLIAANPIVALVAAIAAIVAALIVFRDQITILNDGVTTLGDLFRAAFELGKMFVEELVETLRLLLGPAIRWISGLIPDIDISFRGVLKGVAWVVDRMIGLFLGLGRAIVEIFKGVGPALMTIMVQALNGIVELVQAAINKIVDAVNVLPGIDIDDVELGRINNKWEGAAAEMGRNVRDSFLSGFNQNTISELMDALLIRAQEIGADRRAEELRKAESVNLDRRTTAQKPAGDGKERQRLIDDLRALENQVFPILAAERQLAEAEDVLNRAIAAGLTTRERSVEIMARLREQLQDQLDPLGALNRRLEEQRALLRLTNEEREVQTELAQIERDLREQGIRLGDAELDQIRAKLVESRRINEELEAQRRILEELQGPQREYNAQLAALGSLYQSGSISAEQFRAKAVEIQAALLETRTDALSGLRLGLLEIYQEVTNMADLVKGTVTSIFGSIEDSIVNLVTKGTMDFRKLADQILAEITRIAIRAAIVAPIVQALFPGAAAVPVTPTGLPGFQHGGSFLVGGSGAADSQLVAFRATPGERVTVETPEQRQRAAREEGPPGGQQPVVMNIYTPNAQSFQASRSQVAVDARRLMDRAMRRS